MSYESQPASSSQEHRHPGRMILQLLWIIADVSPAVLMSGPGQSRRFGDARMTSALPLIAEIRRKDRHVRNVPILLQKSKIERPRKSRER